MRNRYWALKLVGILIIIFIIQSVVSGFTNLFVLNSSLVFYRPWTFLTSIFLHGGLGHLLLNGFALALFGSILENIVGSRRFLIIYFLSGLIANIPAAIFYNSSLGASGAIFGVLGTLTILRPKMIIWVSYMPMPMWVAAIVWALQDMLGVFIPSNVANFAHLGGLFFGLVFGFYLKNRSKPLSTQKVGEKQPFKKALAEKRKKKNDIMISEDEIENWEKEHF